MGLKLLNDIYQFRFLFFLRFILSFTFFIFFFFFLWFNSWSRCHVEMCGREDFWISLYPVPHMLLIIPRPFRTPRLNSWGEDFFMGDWKEILKGNAVTGDKTPFKWTTFKTVLSPTTLSKQNINIFLSITGTLRSSKSVIENASNPLRQVNDEKCFSYLLHQSRSV